MKNGKNNPEKLLEKILDLKDPVQFLGVCKILGVDIYEKSEIEGNENNQPRKFEDLWVEICDIINSMNRTRRRNLGKLLYPATKKGGK